MLEYIILGLLMQRGMSGYDIKQYMNDVEFFNASFGNIYPSLKKLEKNGMISLKEVIEGGKYKKVYSINQNGTKKFLEWLEQPASISRSGNEHLIKMFFFHYLPKEKVCFSVSKIIGNVSSSIRHAEVMEKVMKGKIEHFQLKTMHFGIDYYRFILDWYKKLLVELDITN
ncbi:MAG TPA: PadR family transcriptional regulator [Negativicutes bacterium]